MTRGPESLSDAPLTITAVVPNKSAGAAPVAVKISGTGFGPGVAVEFKTAATAALPVTNLKVNSDKEIEVTPPVHPAGAVADVTIRRGGKPPATLPGGYTY